MKTFRDFLDEKEKFRVKEPKLKKGEKTVYGIINGKVTEFTWKADGDNEEWKKKAVAEYQKKHGSK